MVLGEGRSRRGLPRTGESAAGLTWRRMEADVELVGVRRREGCCGHMEGEGGKGSGERGADPGAGRGCGVTQTVRGVRGRGRVRWAYGGDGSTER